ncbi:hypothetical protein PP707_01700 [Acetobacter pasteurianus]|nr:hypothetical protein [Acetobacter pasteurianus]
MKKKKKGEEEEELEMKEKRKLTNPKSRIQLSATSRITDYTDAKTIGGKLGKNWKEKNRGYLCSLPSFLVSFFIC